MNSRLKEILKFAITGGVCFLIELAALIALRDGAGLDTLAATPIAFLISVAVNYLICIRWVFPGAADSGKAKFWFLVSSLIGLGLNWRNYTLSGHDKMFVKANDLVGVVDRDGSVSELSSRVHTSGLSMPLLIKQRFGKNFAISLGALLNWNYYARLSNYYEVGDHEMDDQTKKIGERPITVDILGIVHVAKGFGVYCKYSPMSVFKKDKGPDFKSLSVGFYF